MGNGERIGTLRYPAVLVAALALFCLDFAACSLGSSRPAPVPSAEAPKQTLDDSVPVGLVGIMLLDRNHQPPRACGMNGVILGYVVSHPALPTGLTVRRENQNLPVLAFKLRLVLARADGIGGAEDMRGRGTLEIFYDPNGFSDEVVNNPQAIVEGDEIERDDIRFEGMIDFNDYRYYLRMHEAAVASQPFRFAGVEYRTPVGRVALNIMVGEFNGALGGMPIASSGAMPDLTPAAKLDAMVAPMGY